MHDLTPALGSDAGPATAAFSADGSRLMVRIGNDLTLLPTARPDAARRIAGIDERSEPFFADAVGTLVSTKTDARGEVEVRRDAADGAGNDLLTLASFYQYLFGDAGRRMLVRSVPPDSPAGTWRLVDLEDGRSVGPPGVKGYHVPERPRSTRYAAFLRATTEHRSDRRFTTS